MIDALRGHFWTLGPFLAATVRPVVPPPARHFRVELEDADLGTVRLTGRLRSLPGARGLVVIVHGLGGGADSPYAHLAARAAEDAGMASLRLNLRGADRRGDDYYHAALTDDLRAALGAQELACHSEIYLLGYSLGGHVVLRLMTEEHDPRIRAAAAVCPPLDLASSAREIDRPHRGPYRHHVLRGLKEIYARVAERGRARTGVSVEDALRIRTLAEWDDRIVAPRHGFRDAEDYWARASVAPRLHRIDEPALVVQAVADPMVLEHTVRPCLQACDSVERVWLDRGGHVGFPRDADLGLGLGPKRGLESQVMAWLQRASGPLDHVVRT